MKITNYLQEELYELCKTDESIFDFIQESSLDSLWYWDLEHPEEEWMNPKFWSVLGYDYREMQHSAAAWQDIINPEDLKRATDNFIKYCENPNHPYDQTVRYIHQNGSTVWIRCRGMAIRDKNGKSPRMLGTHQEITGLKKSELLLYESTKKLRNAQQVSKTGSWELDLKTNEVVWTEELYKMYGFDPELPVPPYTDHMKLFTPKSWEQLSAALQLTRELGIPYELELKTIHKNGSQGWMWVRGEAVFDEQKNIIGLRGVAQDISERKRLEENLKEKERKLQDLTNNINESSLISVTDEKGTIIEINKLFCELSGYTVAELVGQNHRIINSGYHDKQFWLDMWKAIAKGEIWRGEIKNRAKDGSEYWVASVINPVKDQSGKISQYISINQDITERKKIEIEKEALTKRLNYALDASGDGIWDWTPADNITVFSKAWMEMLGYEVGDFPSLTSEWSDRLHPDDAEWVFAAINTITQTSDNGDTWIHEYRFRNKIGDYLWILNKAKVVERNEKGEASRVVGTHTNITKQKEAGEEIRRIALLLEAAQKLAKMGAWELNLVTGKTFWTDEVYSIHEVEKDFDHNKENGIEFYHPDYRPIITKAITDSIEQHIPFNIKCKFVTAKNNQRWVRSSGYPVIKNGKLTHLIGMFKDITQEEADKEAIVKEQTFSKQLLENMAEGFSVVDFEGSQIVANKAFCEMTGFSEDELVGQTAPYQYWPSEELENIGKAFKKTLAGDLSTFELTFQKKNGERFPVQVSTGVLKDEYRNTINYFANVKDITAAKKENQHLKLLESVITNTKDSVLITEAEPFDMPGPKIIYVNEAFTKMTGYTAEEVIGKTPRILQGPNSDKIELAKLSKALRKWEACEITTINYKKSGEEFWINFSVTPVADETGWYTHWVAIERDVTEQKKSEQELKESELRFSVAIEGTEAGIWDWDIINNKIIFSIQSKAMLGYEDAEIENSFEGWKKLWHPDDALFIEKAVSDHLSGVSEKYEVIHRCLHKDGGWRWIMNRGKMLRNPAGEPYRWVGTSVDITAQKQAEENQKIAKEQAEAANKAKSEFLANMSHEIRTPLNGVIGFTDLLTKTPLSPVQQQYAVSANVSGHTLLGIINDILDFSKIEAGMLELEYLKTDMVALLENSIDIVKFTADHKKLELLLDIDPAMPRFAYIDAIRTTQILANLLSNAIKFTQNGEVTLKSVYHELNNKQGKLSISVQDTGIGITEEQKSKLFKSFSQADSSTTRKFGGTGLGLVISQMITEKMGSKINIDSTPDFGSTFFFDIITHFEEGEKLDTKQIAGIKRCLIIDDNYNNRLILEQMLKQWQIASDSCSNGLDALQKLEKSQPYDVIICDYDMPYFNGIETIRLMKEKLKLSTEKQAIILLHSSIDNSELSQKSKGLGVYFRLNKPVKSHDLFNYLSNLSQKSETIPPEETEQTVSVSKTSEKIKILVAEDNPLNMMLSKTMLLKLMPNSELYEAKNGLEAVELFKSISPDLIFMDVQMPELDGIEATKKIRALESDANNRVPIVTLTAGALKEEKDRCVAAGMDDFLTKPLEPQKIQTVLNKYFQQGKKVKIVLQDEFAGNETHFGFNELVKNLGNDMKVAQKLISMAITVMPTRIDQLEQACIELDLSNIKSIAHSINGNSLSMRFSILADIARKMEIETKDNSFENIVSLLGELKREWGIVHNLLLQKKDH